MKFEIEIIDHGIDHAQFFLGCGTTFTKYTDVVTGIGDDFAEAFYDCLEQVAMNIGSERYDEFVKCLIEEYREYMEGDSLKDYIKKWSDPNKTVLNVLREEYESESGLTEDDEDYDFDEWLENNPSELWYYVSIRWVEKE
jgi:hypothetical protein